MKLKLITIPFLSTLILISGCTHAEIETKANEVGNILGRLIRGGSHGFVEGYSGKESD